MAILFPRSDVLTAVGFVGDTYEFKLNYRQEQSRTAGGATLVKDFGTPLWGFKATTQALRLDDALDYEALLETLDGGLHTFLAYDLRRPYPRSHPSGDFSDTGEIASLGSDNKSLALSNLDASFQLSRGDYLSIVVGGARSLHLVCEPAQASAEGDAPVFEVRPHLPVGVEVGQPVTLKRPSTAMTIMPGSIVKTQMGGLHTSVSFSALQAINP